MVRLKNANWYIKIGLPKINKGLKKERMVITPFLLQIILVNSPSNYLLFEEVKIILVIHFYLLDLSDRRLIVLPFFKVWVVKDLAG